MVPVSQEQFDLRIREQKDTEGSLSSAGPTIYQCTACRKSFKSSEMLEQHFASKKHSKAAQGASDEDCTKKGSQKAASSEGEELTEEQRVSQAIDRGRRLGFLECSFCGITFETVEDTVQHIAKEHGCFIGDVEYLSDLPGLISYIGDKVGVGHCCLYCDKPFESLEGCRMHMKTMGHCKMVADSEEFDDFYDFSSTYDAETLRSLPELRVSPDGTQLYIGDSGRAIGHRDLRVYYDQNPRLGDGRAVIVAATRGGLMSQYKQIGQGGHKSSLETVESKKMRQKVYRAEAKKREKMGTKTEQLNEKYFLRRDLAW